MPRNSTLSEQYDDFIDKYITTKLKHFLKNDNEISVRFHHGDQQNQSTIFLGTIDSTATLRLSNYNTYCSIHDREIDNSSCISTINEKDEGCITEFHPDSIEDKFLKFVMQNLFSDTNLSIRNCSNADIQGCASFTKEQLVQKLQEYKNKPDFHQIDIANATKNNPVEYCHTFVKEIKSATTEKAALAESLSSIKSETQNITDALKETGAVSPGSGLMPNQESCYPKPPYFGREEYLVTVNSLLGKKLKKFEDQISFKVKEFYKYSNIYVGPTRFEITDTAGNTMKVSYLGENKGWNLKVNDENLTFECNQSKSRAFEIITRYIYDNVYSKKNENGTRVKLKSCDTFNKIDFLTSLKDIPNTEGYEHYFRGKLSGDVSKSPSPFNCSFYPIDAAAGLTIIVSSIAISLLTNTTPEIGYSTNAPITNSSFGTATNKPEQNDNIDKSHIAVIVGFALLIFGIGAVCAICFYVNRRTSNKKNIESRFASYKKFKNVNDDVRNKRLSTIEEGQGKNEQGTVAEGDTEPLLPNNNQPSAPTSGGKEISDVDMANAQKALKGRWLPNSPTSAVQNNESQSSQCSGAGSVTAGMLKSNTLFKKQVEANNKSQETPKSGEQLESELDNAMQTLKMLRNGLQSNQLIGATSKVAQATIELADKAKAVVSPSNERASSSLKVTQVEGAAQQTPAIG